MSKAYIFIAEGHEEVEALSVVDICRRVGVDMVTVSITGNKTVTSSHKVTWITDILFEEGDFSDADILILPGGMPGTKNLEAYMPLMELLDKQLSDGKKIAAICAAPTVFGHRGLLQGKKACCYPGMEEGLDGAIVTYDPVTVDGQIITSRGLGTAIEFGLTICEELGHSEKANQVGKAIVYR